MPLTYLRLRWLTTCTDANHRQRWLIWRALARASLDRALSAHYFVHCEWPVPGVRAAAGVAAWAECRDCRLRFSSILLIVAGVLVVQSLCVTAQPFAELNNTSIQNAVALWTSSDLAVRTQAAERYNNITYWDVSKITQMPTELFFEKRTFNADLSGWDVSKNENMGSMFSRASLFNSTLGSWDTSKVKNMDRTFYRASVFNSDVSLWCV